MHRFLVVITGGFHTWPVTTNVRVHNNLVAYIRQGIAFGSKQHPSMNYQGIKVARNTFAESEQQFDAFVQNFSGNENFFKHRERLSRCGYPIEAEQYCVIQQPL